MDTSQLERFAKYARQELIQQVATKLKAVLVDNSLARRENAKAVQILEKDIKKDGEEQVIDKVAYIWFNRFCALRFMDIKGYNKHKVLSPADVSQFQPEIFADAKSGFFDNDIVDSKIQERIQGLFIGDVKSLDPQNEAYRLLIVSVCNYWHKSMPYMFQKISDYTELLMPDDLLSGGSILAYTREAMLPINCEDVEVLGWLYQYYISERKDEVFTNLQKKNVKINTENIPAATQLFTPNWIVRYLVQNSLGRLWLLNRPQSSIIEQMEYYIPSEEKDIDYVKINSAEEIKICDPACGSGHMLVYAFDLMYSIYEEEGINPQDIPILILKNNLFGIEIDERAGELAAFALAMKAREKDKNYFKYNAQPNICVLENVEFSEDILAPLLQDIDSLEAEEIKYALNIFAEAKNFGSLIEPDFKLLDNIKILFEKKNTLSSLFTGYLDSSIELFYKQIEYLRTKYHIVVANPPYMGSKGMNNQLSNWLKLKYEDAKSDLFSAFIVRNTRLAKPKGFLGFMTPFVWMFISSYEKLRTFIIENKTITSLIQLEYSGFAGATVPICTFTLSNNFNENYKGGYIRLADFRGAENQAPKALEAIRDKNSTWFYRSSQNNFSKIPTSPIAYWVSEQMLKAFDDGINLASIAKPRQGLATGCNDMFLRSWHEVTIDRISFNSNSQDEADLSQKKWFPCTKGGSFRRWYGNNIYIVNWENDGYEIKNFKDEHGKVRSRPQNTQFYFKSGLSWTAISSSLFSLRFVPIGSLFETKGPMCFVEDEYKFYLLALYNTLIMQEFLSIISPTLDYHEGPLGRTPVIINEDRAVDINKNTSKLLSLSKSDWDSYETSWDFTLPPLLTSEFKKGSIEESYKALREHWANITKEMQRLEEKNNRIFIDIYGLSEELTSEVPLKEISLTCNPYYRYGDKKSEAELEKELLADTMKEFISYAVGCMFGRYSIDKEGLILANQGEGLNEFKDKVENISYNPDDDNVIPILSEKWFEDDIERRFKEFVSVLFDKEQVERNINFIEQALNTDNKAKYSLRDYFIKEFYSHHVKTYKKHPIYWLFSSPKGTFNAITYMHRHKPDTLSVLLNNYLRELIKKLISKKDELEKKIIAEPNNVKLTKEINTITSQIKELEDYERDVIYPLATQKIEIDLDDGVKVNYAKFGKALKKL